MEDLRAAKDYFLLAKGEFYQTFLEELNFLPSQQNLLSVNMYELKYLPTCLSRNFFRFCPLNLL